MAKHKHFFLGMAFAATAGLSLDLLVVHQISNHHHLYNGPSVNIVEPIISVIFAAIAVIVFRKEF